jgi:hypothetical protein
MASAETHTSPQQKGAQPIQSTPLSRPSSQVTATRKEQICHERSTGK